MTDLDAELKNPKPEPEKFEKRFLKLGMEWETNAHISWRIENEHYIRFNSIPRTKRQEILDTMMKGGISISEVAQKFGVENDVVASVIFLNIRQIAYMPQQSK